MTYAEQLKSPKWQKKRLEILERDNFTCTSCGDKEKQLHVHHGAYLSKLKVWDYDHSMLHTLCYDCHLEVEDYIYEMNECIGSMRQNLNNFDIVTMVARYANLLNESDVTIIQDTLQIAFDRSYVNFIKSKNNE
jgi:hypothetical protein